MNPYTRNLNRIEFVVTYACTGKCKHCSEGEHKLQGEHLKGEAAAEAVYRVAEKYKMDSLMTFGGEPLLFPDVVCQIHRAGKEAGIPKRQLITNGFFSKEKEKIKRVVEQLAESGVNAVLLSVDAFHQETIPLETVKTFAGAVKEAEIPIRTHPAWLRNQEAENEYNRKTREILEVFTQMGIFPSEGNIIFPSGNALKYLREYFDSSAVPVNPYIEKEDDIRCICIEPNGDVLSKNVYWSDIMEILDGYVPPKK